MNSMTNKSLVLLVFCVIGHTIVSADVEDCKLRVKEVFKDNQSPLSHFLHALSEYNEQYFTTTVQNDEALGYFKFLIKEIQQRNAPDNTSQETDTFYMKDQRKLYAMRHSIMSPVTMCMALKIGGKLLNLDEKLCYESLQTMLTHKDADLQAKAAVRKMKGTDALIFVYLNYIYDDMRQYMEERMNSNSEAESSGNQQFESESSDNEPDATITQHQISIMLMYYDEIRKGAKDFDYIDFPSVDYYCRMAEFDKQQKKSSTSL